MYHALLALLLALDDLSISLTIEVRQELLEISEQLAANPSAWEVIISSRVEALISTVPGLQEIFTKYEAQLVNLPNSMLQEEWWLPEDSAELTKLSPPEGILIAKGFPPSSEAIDHNGKEISNITIPIRIISTPRPEETVKRIKAFKRLKDKLRLLIE